MDRGARPAGLLQVSGGAPLNSPSGSEPSAPGLTRRDTSPENITALRTRLLSNGVMRGCIKVPRAGLRGGLVQGAESLPPCPRDFASTALADCVSGGGAERDLIFPQRTDILWFYEFAQCDLIARIMKNKSFWQSARGRFGADIMRADAPVFGGGVTVAASVSAPVALRAGLGERACSCAGTGIV